MPFYHIGREQDNSYDHEPLYDLQEGSWEASTSNPWTTAWRSGKPCECFYCVGIDYAGPVLVKYGPVCKPCFTKGYVTVLVCLATNAVHLELVSDLSTSAIVATLRRFIGRRAIPSTIWSDQGMNFVRAGKVIPALLRQNERSTWAIAGFCTCTS